MGGGNNNNKIDFDEDKRMKFETSKEVNVTSTFDGMGIREDLLRGLYAYGFEKPSAIQQRAVLPITSGRDVIAQAQSGTGKTSMISLSSVSDGRYNAKRSASVGVIPNERISGSNRENSVSARKLHERASARVHWWTFYRRRHSKIRLRRAHSFRDAWESLRHD